MTTRKPLVILFSLCSIALAGTSLAGDWQAAPIDDLGGLQNANTEMKKSTSMEVGRRDGANGHPEAWGEMEIDCGEHRSSEKQWCNIQLEIIFAKKVDSERVKIEVFGGDGQILNTAYLFNQTTGDVRSRVYVIGVECDEEVNPTVRVAITGAKDSVAGNARVTFLRAKCEREDKTNWLVGSNWPLYQRDGRPFKRPTFLIGV